MRLWATTSGESGSIMLIIITHLHPALELMLIIITHLHPALESCITSLLCLFVTFNLNFHLHPALESYINTVVAPFTLCFYFNPASNRLLSHTLPLYLQFYYLLCHFTNFKFPTPPGSWVIHYHCIYGFYLFCLFINFNLNSHIHVALGSYITTVVIPFTLCFYFNPTVFTVLLFSWSFY